LYILCAMSTSLVHVAYKPVAASPGKPPLLVLLHGVGSNEEDLLPLASYLDERFFIISLRAPLSTRDGGYGWFPIEWTPTGIKHDEKDAIDGQAAAEKAIDELVEMYDLDPDRVYLMGFSQGAMISLGIMLIHPEKVAGAVIMSGRILPNVAANAAEPERLSGKPILVVHGTQDSIVPIAEGRHIAAYLKGTPVDLTYNEYDIAHTVTEETLADITAWLTKQLDRKD
jgi:phospholipase/carboxylesterase